MIITVETERYFDDNVAVDDTIIIFNNESGNHAPEVVEETKEDIKNVSKVSELKAIKRLSVLE